MEIVLTPPLSTVITKLAKEHGKDVYNFLVDIISEKIDPKTRIDIYIMLFKKLLTEAEKLEAQGDTVQASEKYWGAIAALLDIIGEKKKKPHYTHRDYWEIMNMIIDEMKDESLAELFALAEKLHSNFYHDFIPRHQFKIYSRKIKILIKKLISYVERLGIKIYEQEK